MPPNRATRGQGAPGLKPRRTHNLGGCTTCRRRHVKCDQNRPFCTVCRDGGLDCEGFPSQIRWASTSIGPPPGSDESRSRQGRASPRQKRGLEARADDERDAPNSPRRCINRRSLPGLDLSLNDQHSTNETGNITDITDLATLNNAADSNIGLDLGANDPDRTTHTSSASFSDLESLLDVCNGLGWNDLFNSTMSPIPSVQDQAFNDSFVIAATTANLSYDINKHASWYDRSFTPSDTRNARAECTVPAILELAPPPYASIEISEADVLKEAQVSLKHFRDAVIPQLCPLPMISKSPWEVLNWSAAVQTHADMTFLETQDIKHASKANFFAIMGCAVHSMIKESTSLDSNQHQQKMEFFQYASRAAKQQMQRSLRVETCGPQKAKYKDQLMAIFSLIALATLSGNGNEARCYLIDAERLLRYRGLAKREVSRRARLLHHVYTWLRIIGESTFTIHDYESSNLQAKLDNLIGSNHETRRQGWTSDEDRLDPDDQYQLDDFLRIETQATDNESDADAARDQASGLRDIHLASTQQWTKTLYMDIYGIPEIWLKLVSQTTRVANIVDLLEQRPSQASSAFLSSLQRETTRLEHMVCSLSAQYSGMSPAPPPSELCDISKSKSPSASQAMLRALGSGLVILFYRRVRKVHPWILQSHVADVRNALEKFQVAQEANSVVRSGSPWPAFIAGCEAMSQSNRDWFKAWMRNGAAQSACNAFAPSLAVMEEVWDRRDKVGQLLDDSAKSSSGHKITEVPSWVDVLRDTKSWLMLY